MPEKEEAIMQALRHYGVIHIGDSISSDVHGAAKVGIRALWLNRFGKSIPEGVESITRLSEAFDRIGQ